MCKTNISGNSSVEDKWTILRDSIKSGAEEVFGFQKANSAKKPWITDRIIEKMEQRRKWKSKNTEEGRRKYKNLKNEL